MPPPLSRPLVAALGITTLWLAAWSASAAGAPGSAASTTPVSLGAHQPARTFAARAPGPIAGQGYHLVFQDNFRRFRSRVWTRKIWYDDKPPAGSIYVRRGVLHLVSRRSHQYRSVTVTTLKSRSFRRGYFEARMRWTKGHGAWPAFWLVSTRHAKNPAWPSINPYCANHGLPAALCWNSELDVFEGQGTEPHTFYGTLHKSTNGYYGVPDSTNDPAWRSVGADLTKGFHRYAALWTATEVRWYLDGVELLRTPTFASTDQPMFLLLQMWTCGWAPNDCDNSTPDSLQTKVDWVRVWRR